MNPRLCCGPTTGTWVHTMGYIWLTACGGSPLPPPQVEPQAQLIANYEALWQHTDPDQRSAILAQVLNLSIGQAAQILLGSGLPQDQFRQALLGMQDIAGGSTVGDLLTAMNLKISVPTPALLKSERNTPHAAGAALALAPDDNRNAYQKILAYYPGLCESYRTIYDSFPSLNANGNDGQSQSIATMMQWIKDNGFPATDTVPGNRFRVFGKRQTVFTRQQLRTYYYWCFTDQEIPPGDERWRYPDGGAGGSSSGGPGGTGSACEGSGGTFSEPGTWHPNADYFGDCSSGFSGHSALSGVYQYSG